MIRVQIIRLFYGGEGGVMPSWRSKRSVHTFCLDMVEGSAEALLVGWFETTKKVLVYSKK